MARVRIPANIDKHPADYAFSRYAPKIAQAALAYSRVVYEETSLSVKEMEAARYRTALINGCSACTHARAVRDFDTHLPRSTVALERPMSSRGETPDEDFYEAVPDWRTADIFSPRERLAIEFAERFAEEPRSMRNDEEFWSRMKSNFSDDEMMDLALSIGSWMALGRARNVLEIDTISEVAESEAA